MPELWSICVTYTKRQTAIFQMWNNSTVCELYGKVREKWPHLSEQRFILLNGIKQLSAENARNLELDDCDLSLDKNSMCNVYITIQTSGGSVTQPASTVLL